MQEQVHDPDHEPGKGHDDSPVDDNLIQEQTIEAPCEPHPDSHDTSEQIEETGRASGATGSARDLADDELPITQREFSSTFQVCLSKWEQTTLKTLRKACKDLPKDLPMLRPSRPHHGAESQAAKAIGNEVQAIVNSLKNGQDSAGLLVDSGTQKSQVGKGVVEKEVQRYCSDTIDKLIQRCADVKEASPLHERVKEALSGAPDDLSSSLAEQRVALWKDLNTVLFDRVKARANSVCEKQLPLALKQSVDPLSASVEAAMREAAEKMSRDDKSSQAAHRLRSVSTKLEDSQPKIVAELGKLASNAMQGYADDIAVRTASDRGASIGNDANAVKGPLLHRLRASVRPLQQEIEGLSSEVETVSLNLERCSTLAAEAEQEIEAIRAVT